MGNQYTNERAGQILSDVLGGTVVLRDIPGAPPGTHDLDIICSKRGTIAVEVTISTNQAILAFWAAAHRQAWDAPELRYSWLLNVNAPTRLSGLRDQVVPLLKRLE